MWPVTAISRGKQSTANTCRHSTLSDFSFLRQFAHCRQSWDLLISSDWVNKLSCPAVTSHHTCLADGLTQQSMPVSAAASETSVRVEACTTGNQLDLRYVELTGIPYSSITCHWITQLTAKYRSINYLRNRLPVWGGCVYVLQMFFLHFFCFFLFCSVRQKYETTVLGNGWTDFHETFTKR